MKDDKMINDELKILEVPNIKGTNPGRDEIVRILFEQRKNIEEKFTESEFIKMDLTHGEIIGLKSTAEFGKLKIGDLPALDYIIRNDDKYRKSTIINLGNVDMLFQEMS
jgi:hypothetical protein